MSSLPGPGPDIHDLPYRMGHLVSNDPDIGDIYDDYQFKHNAVNNIIGEENLYFDNMSLKQVSHVESTFKSAKVTTGKFNDEKLI